MSDTVSDIIRDKFNVLTRAERKLANVLLDNCPVSGMTSITRLAELAEVSPPSVVRMAQKLGFTGFPDLQNALRDELEATISNPFAKHDRWSQQAPDTHILNRFADAVIDNLRQSLDQLPPEDFDRVSALLADRKRAVYIVGGRITHALADYLFTHLQVLRENITLGSPVGKAASHRFNIRIEAPSAWDSSVVTLFMLEALTAAVETRIWGVTKSRMKQLEALFDRRKLFR